jgi:branched-chain amino acid transport system substrate-binding protein
MKRSNSNRLAIIPLTLLSSIAIIGLLPVGSAVAASNTVIKIGVVTDLSTAYSYYGDMEVNGLAMGLAYAVGATNLTQAIQSTPSLVTVTGGGYTFQLYIADGASDATTSAAKAVQLITQDGVQILQGAPDSDSAIAVASVAAQYHVIFMAAPAADYDITAQNFNVYTFRMASNSYQDALTGGAYAVQNLGKSFALIAPDYSWGYGEVAAWTSVISNAGGRVLTTQYAPVGTTDFTPYIDNILASNSTVVIPIWAGAGAVQLYQQLYSLGVYKHMDVTSGVPDLATFNALLAAYMPNYVGMMKYAFNLPTSSVNTWMIQQYITLFKENKLPEQNALTFPLPDLFMPDSFATGQAVVAALQATGNTTAAPNMIHALEGMTLNTPKGQMYIRPQDHQAIQEMYIVKVVYDNSTMSKYYTGPSQFPAGSDWAGIFKTGFFGVQLIETLNSTQTAPPIDPTAAAQQRPALPVTTTTTTTTAPSQSSTTDYLYGAVVVIVILVVAVAYLATRPKKA